MPDPFFSDSSLADRSASTKFERFCVPKSCTHWQIDWVVSRGNRFVAVRPCNDFFLFFLSRETQTFTELYYVNQEQNRTKTVTGEYKEKEKERESHRCPQPYNLRQEKNVLKKYIFSFNPLVFIFFLFLFWLMVPVSMQTQLLETNTETHNNNAAHLATFQLTVIHISKIDFTTTQTLASLKTVTNFLTHIVEILDKDCVINHRFSTFWNLKKNSRILLN